MKYYQSPRWSSEFLDCSMPMTFDTYNKCSYDCLYCFSYYQKSHSPSKSHKDYQKEKLLYVNTQGIKDLFRNKKKSQFSEVINNKLVMQWGGLADQFDEYERRYGITLNLMKLFDELDYPLSFSTKSVWWTKDERYMKLVRKHQHNWHFKFSIINLDKKKAKRLEKGCPSPQERLKGIKRVSDVGCHVTLRFRPFIIGYSNVNGEHIKLIKMARDAGVDSVSMEFFCLEQRADRFLKARYKEMSKIIGFDILKFYKKHSLKRGYLRLNYEIKTKYINEIKNECDKLGLRFYVSDAHHKEKCSNGSCCGLPCSFNYSRGQFTEALMIAKKNGEVKFSDIAPNHFKNILWRRAIGLNTKSTEARVKSGNLTLYDVMKNKWNKPNDLNSPYKYFNGVLIPKELDNEGNIIYQYKK